MQPIRKIIHIDMDAFYVSVLEVIPNQEGLSPRVHMKSENSVFTLQCHRQLHTGYARMLFSFGQDFMCTEPSPRKSVKFSMNTPTWLNLSHWIWRLRFE